jgi:ERCC4-type nuclease
MIKMDNTDSPAKSPETLRRYEPEDLIPEITLSMVGGVGSTLTQRLLDHFGDAESILAANATQLQAVEGIGPKIAKSISLARSLCNPEALITQCREHGRSSGR